MSKLEQRITIAAVVIPFLGFIVAIILLWNDGVNWLDLAILAGMYVFTGVGVTVGYHRLFTHRSFATPEWMRVLLAIAGSMSVQGAPIHWVADHRKHHQNSDHEGDPHSPHTHNHSGVKGVFVGWYHSHMGWLFSREDRASATRYAPDLKKDPKIVQVDRHFFLWVLLGLLIPFALGWAIGGTLAAGFTAFIWGGLVRIFLQHHATWSVNSVCHMYGDRPFETGDQSTNNWAVAFVSLGEGWHHNHHAFPTSARHGLTGRQFDPAWVFIRTLELVGLAHDVRLPSERQLQKKLRVGSDAEQFAPQRNSEAATADAAAVVRRPATGSEVTDTSASTSRAATLTAEASEDQQERQVLA